MYWNICTKNRGNILNFEVTGSEKQRSRKYRFSFSQHYSGTTEATILHNSSICIIPEGVSCGYISGA